MTSSESEQPELTEPIGSIGQPSYEPDPPTSTAPYGSPPQANLPPVQRPPAQETPGQSPEQGAPVAYSQPVAYRQPGGYGPPAHFTGGPQQPMAYGLGHPGQGFGVQPGTGLPYSDKSKTTAGLLQVLLPFIGVAGVGRLYAGHTAIGLIQLIGLFVGYLLIFVLIGLVIAPVIWIWAVIDGIVMLAGSPVDDQGRPLRP